MNALSKRLLALCLTLYFGFLSTGTTLAQCGMCRAVAENGVDENGQGVAAGINSGIIFLMGIPYILLTILVLVFFRKQFFSFWKSFSNIHAD